MYEAHWNLTARPFENRPVSRFYYPSEAHQAALLKLRYAIENRRSIGLICGHSGMGKSMLLHQLRDQMPDLVGPIVHVAYPALSPEQLVQYIAHQLAPEAAVNASSLSMAQAIQSIESALAKSGQEGKHPILIIDEAEWLDEQGTLPTLRLLLNLANDAVSGESAFSLLLSGQPTLLAQLERYPALDQRVAVRCLLNRFTSEETTAYIGHRIRAAGGNIERIFSAETFEGIHHRCDGIPRRINSLCDLALMVGYAQEQSSINLDLIENVHRELVPLAS